MHTEKQEQNAAHFPEDAGILVQERAEIGGGCAQEDEDCGKSEDKGQRVQHGGLADLVARVFILQIDEGKPGDVGDIGRDQRQDAGRQKREQPGDERSEIGDLLGVHRGLCSYFIRPSIKETTSAESQAIGPMTFLTRMPFLSMMKDSGTPVMP